jgi:long-chain acyl-CoA synthetase
MLLFLLLLCHHYRIAGHNVFSGYYKLPDVTSESLTSDGWFMTGDVGVWLDDGVLKIIDRKKNLFKLSQGEYIRPEYIEGVYKQHRHIANIFVHGDSHENYLVAIVVPDFESLRSWISQHGLTGSKPEEIIKDSRLVKLIEQDMQEQASKEKLRGFEVVRRIALCAEDFTVENDLITPSFKLKRHTAKIRFQDVIKQLYSTPQQITSKL